MHNVMNVFIISILLGVIVFLVVYVANINAKIKNLKENLLKDADDINDDSNKGNIVSLKDHDRILHDWLHMKLDGHFDDVTIASHNIVVWHRPFKHMELERAYLRLDIMPIEINDDSSSILQACLDYCQFGDLYIRISPKFSIFYSNTNNTYDLAQDLDIVLFEKGLTLEKMLIQLDLKAQ